MNKLEYIPGDFVKTNGVPLGTAKDVVYRVTSSDPENTLELDDGTVLKGVVCLENIEGAEFGNKGYLSGDCCAWVKDIVPIPLTPKIIEKDGFEVRYSGMYCTKSINCRCGFCKDILLSSAKITTGQYSSSTSQYQIMLYYVILSMFINSSTFSSV